MTFNRKGPIERKGASTADGNSPLKRAASRENEENSELQHAAK